MTLADLKKLIDTRAARLAVIGLGYVGLPVACEFARAGFDVTGIDLQVGRVEKINAGVSPIVGKEPGLQELLTQVVAAGKLVASTRYTSLSEQDVVIICVDTPVDDDHIPQYQALIAAIDALSSVLKPGSLVIVESTISPGTMQQVVLPGLEKSSGKKLNRDFYLGNCPERVMPGRLLANICHVSRVAGGMTPETAEVMRSLYTHIVCAEIDVTDCLTAELVKTVENTYRDVQIAFANEVSLICEAAGGDIWSVRELVNKSPGRAMLLPGAGVGGHCIPKDPWLLAHAVSDGSAPLHLIPAARRVNDHMPYHMLEIVEQALHDEGGRLHGARILILGYAYLEESDDARNSPSAVLQSYLEERGAHVVIHDPYVSPYQGDMLDKAAGCDAVVVMVNHQVYRSMDLSQLSKILLRPLMIDGRRVVSPDQAARAGLRYRGLGIGWTEKNA